MNQFFIMAQTQSLLFIYLVIGYVMKKVKLVDAGARSSINNILIYVALPCMIFESFNITLTRDNLTAGFSALAIASVWAVVALVFGKFAYNWCPKGERDIMQYGTLVSNSGFAGLPVVDSVYGSEGLFLASLYIIPTRILMWSAGISLFTEAPVKERIRKVALNPGIIAVYVGIIRMILQPQFPVPVSKALSVLGSLTTPLSMILIGMILAEIDIKSVLNRKAFVLVGVRQFLLPLSLLVFMKCIHADSMVTQVGCVLTGMPIGSTTSILADKYGADATFAAKCVFISTLTSLITVPIISLFF